MRIYQLILTHKNTSKALWDNDIHTLQNGRKMFRFPLFYDDQDTESE